MATPSWVQEVLDSRGINYITRQHPPSYTAQSLAEREHISGYQVAKVVAVNADGQMMMCVLPAPYEVDLDAFQQMIGADHARLATEAEIAERFVGCEVGATPPLPYWSEVDIWMDERLGYNDQLTFAAGTHEDSVTIDFDDWRELASPKVAKFAAIRH